MPTERKPTRKPPALSVSDKAFRRAAVLAVMSGIYASHGEAILSATDGDRLIAMRAAARVAVQQADLVLKAETGGSL